MLTNILKTSKIGEKCDEVQVILEAKKLQEQSLRTSFRQDAELWDETRK